MKTTKIFEYIGIGLLLIGMLVLIDENIRHKALSLFNTKPYIELSGNQLNIKEFDWSYGTINIDQFHGDFDKLDSKVFDLLKGKTGTCKVFLQGTARDKYGNADSTMNYIGDINIDELNKYQQWSYWQKEAGIRHLLYKKINKPENKPIQPDTTVTSLETTQPAIQKSIAKPTIYSFAINDLYPIEETQNDFDQHRFNINGTIGQ